MFRFYYQPIKINESEPLKLSPQSHDTWTVEHMTWTCLSVFFLSRPYCCSSPSVSRSTSLSVYTLCLCVSLSLSVYFCVSFFRLTLVSFPFFLSASPSIYLHVYTTPRLFLYLSVFLSFCPSFYLSVCLSVCLRISLSDEQQGVKIPSLREVLDCVEVRVVE